MRPSTKEFKYNDHVNSVFVIHHVKTKKVFVGRASHPGKQIHKHYLLLKKGIHYNLRLQEAYNDSDDIYHVYFTVKTKDAAIKLKKGIITFYSERERSFNRASYNDLLRDEENRHLKDAIDTIDNPGPYRKDGYATNTSEAFPDLLKQIDFQMEGIDDLEVITEGVVRGVKRIGAYIIHHPETQMSYVGSSGNVYVRIVMHRSELRLGQHMNGKLQAAYDKDPNVTFVCFKATSRKEAYDIEQRLLDKNWSSSRLCNSSSDALNALKPIVYKGMKLKGEHLKNVAKSNRERMLKRRKKVSIKGIVYDGVRDAALKLGMNYSTVQRFINYTSDEHKEWFYVA